MARNVLLTGASSGIGEALAVQIAARGDRLALLARRRAELERVAERARIASPQPDGVSCYVADVTDRARVRTIVGEFERSVGSIDLLILNAGISENVYADPFDDERAARVLEVNAVSPVYALGAVLPGMVSRRSGQVVGVGSLAGYRGFPGAAPYCASKAALSTLLEGLRPELRQHGVRVTTVSPGFVKTPLTAKNRHPMPWLVEVDAAARRILVGVDKGKREVRFPWQWAAVMRVLRAMPDWSFDILAGKIERPPSATPGDGGVSS